MVKYVKKCFIVSYFSDIAEMRLESDKQVNRLEHLQQESKDAGRKIHETDVACDRLEEEITWTNRLERGLVGKK